MPITNTTKAILQNYLLIWFNPDADESKQTDDHILRQFRNIIDEVLLFKEINACVDFLTEINERHIFLVTSEHWSQILVPFIHSIPNLIILRLLDDHVRLKNSWIKQNATMENLHYNVQSLCDTLRKRINQLNQNFISISFPCETTDPRYLCSQIFKDAVLEIEYDQQSRNDLIEYCRRNRDESSNERKTIDEFERDYSPNNSIWWYTRECFIFQLINRALLSFDGEILMEMGFFISDLHRQITELHEQQIQRYSKESLLLYRGQALSETDFHQLQNNPDRLISFNSFISTSKYREGAFNLAESSAQNLNTYGIIFVMTVDPTMKTVPFANISNVSYSRDEEEFLFAMNSVFRIEKIEKQDEYNRLYQVHLSLTAYDDQDLRLLTNHLGSQFSSSSSGFYKLVPLFILMEQYEVAESFLKKTVITDGQSNHTYVSTSLLTLIKLMQGTQQELQTIAGEKLPDDHISHCIRYQILALRNWLMQNTFSTNMVVDKMLNTKPILASNSLCSLMFLYAMRANIVSQMGDFSQSLLLLEYVLQMNQVNRPENQRDLCHLHMLIAMEYLLEKEYDKAIIHLDTAMDILKQSLPNDLVLLTLYFNLMAFINEKTGTSSGALVTMENYLETHSNLQPEAYPFYFIMYNDIATIHHRKEDYSKALTFFEKALQICQISPHNTTLRDYTVATVYKNIGLTYIKIGNHVKALPCFQQSLKCYEKSVSPNDLILSDIYVALSHLYNESKDYSNCVFLLEKALALYENVNSPDLISLIKTYNNIGHMYVNLRNADQAASFLHKALGICEKECPNNLEFLMIIYHHLSVAYSICSEWLQAQKYMEKTLEIRLQLVPNDYTSLADEYLHLGVIQTQVDNVFEALSSFQKANDYMLINLPEDHISFGHLYMLISVAYMQKQSDEEAIPYAEKALAIFKTVLPNGDPYLAIALFTLGCLYVQTDRIDEGLNYLEQSNEIVNNSFPPEHPFVEYGAVDIGRIQ